MAELPRLHVRPQGMPVEHQRRLGPFRAAERRHALHDLRAAVVLALGPAPGPEQVVAVDHVRHGAPAPLDLDELAEEGAALLGLLLEDLLELAGVEEDPLAVRAAVDGDALELLLLHVVAAFRALHEVEVLEAPRLLRLLLGGALRLPFDTGVPRRLQELLLVPEEPLVFALGVLFDHRSPSGTDPLRSPERTCDSMSTNALHRAIIPANLAIPAAPVLESPGGALADAFPISGQIDPKAFPFLVVQLHRRGATGSLKVEGPSYHKALYFRSGRVLFGSSNDPRDQLGAILNESGKITPEQLADVNAKVGPGNPLAKVLAHTGFVSQRELSDAARAKVERILSDVLAYTTGKFDFEDGVLPKGAVDLKLATERLVMAAVRRVTDRNFVLRHIDGLDAILGPTAD